MRNGSGRSCRRRSVVLLICAVRPLLSSPRSMRLKDPERSVIHKLSTIKLSWTRMISVSPEFISLLERGLILIATVMFDSYYSTPFPFYIFLTFNQSNYFVF